jgi:hypothetical protein
MSFIDTNVKVTKDQRAVIEKYNLSVGVNKDDLIEVDDEYIHKYYAFKDASKKGKYIAKKINEALAEAVKVRTEHEAKADAKGAAKDAKSEANGADKSATALTNKKGNPVPVADPEPAAPAPAAKKEPRVLAAKAEKPEDEIEDVDLDDTGKREKRSKVKKEKTPRGDNRYLRASKIIAANLSITREELSKQANMSVSTAGFCIEAWRGVVAALAEKNAFDKAWTTLLTKTVEKPAEKKGKKPSKK